ncbi:TdeIII family type II restriction endonuclease [Methanoculleus sp. FWC-SCC1]|uniref:type II site-specific deoxyribonuclease n=1 Tax=Methanoculleus frigidifontis TaxID=2584085 RepID=A0ABT8MCW9_9EURY|nr:TdeIII family type II restriction endonuclease [Methanoculleus sp. FWC-SCC1]MDN7025792.1 TdeIII family type II restriction endonuclease [Methanoculleus sp. FWC-SCC1]
MIDAVLSARRDDDLVPLKATADLYIRTKDGRRYYFEMKSPMPNKGQCLEVTQRLLWFHLLAGESRPAVQAYFAMAYNPYGPKRSDYTWNFALNYTPFGEAVLIADEFWNIVGGKHAMEDLLSVYQEVGREKTKYMLDSLAFGF